MSNTVIELWGGLHDGKRVAVRAERNALPATYEILEPAPIRAQADAQAKPKAPGKLRYTYTHDTKDKAKKNLYRFTSCAEVEP